MNYSSWFFRFYYIEVFDLNKISSIQGMIIKIGFHLYIIIIPWYPKLITLIFQSLLGQMVTDTGNPLYNQSFPIVLAQLSQNFRHLRSWMTSQIKFFQINSIFNCAACWRISNDLEFCLKKPVELKKWALFSLVKFILRV